MVLVNNLVTSRYEGGLALVAGWFAASAMCFVNYTSCGRYYCKITGPGFLGLGILTLIGAIGMANIPAWIASTLGGTIMMKILQN